jgi:hypothetical protein
MPANGQSAGAGQVGASLRSRVQYLSAGQAEGACPVGEGFRS